MQFRPPRRSIVRQRPVFDLRDRCDFRWKEAANHWGARITAHSLTKPTTMSRSRSPIGGLKLVQRWPTRTSRYYASRRFYGLARPMITGHETINEMLLWL